MVVNDITIMYNIDNSNYLIGRCLQLNNYFIREVNMNKFKFKCTKNIQALIILLITFGAMCLLYGNTYGLTADIDKLEDAVSNYIFNDDVKAEVELIQKENGWMYVVFSDSKYGNGFKGLARLKRGWNGKYVLYDANYGSTYPVSLYLFRNDNSKLAIYGLIPDGRAVRFEYVKTGAVSESEVVFSGRINQKAFVQVCDNDSTAFMNLHLYDIEGNDITESYSINKSNNAPNAGIGSAELFIVDFLCIIILVLGFLLILYCYRK